MFRSHSSWVNKDTTSFSDQFRKMLSATIPAPILMPVPVSCRTVHSILPESFPPGNSGKSIFSDGPLTETANAHAPAVYYTSDIGTESLLQLYKPLSWALPGKTVVKIPACELPVAHYLGRGLSEVRFISRAERSWSAAPRKVQAVGFSFPALCAILKLWDFCLNGGIKR